MKLLLKCIVVALVVSFALCCTPSAASNSPFLENSSLSLEDVVAVALSHHPDLKAAEQNIQASLSRTSQRTASYWPAINMNATYGRGNYLGISGPVSSLITLVYLNYTTRFSATYTLEDFGKRFAEVSEAKAQLTENEARYHDTRSKIIFNAAEAYFKVLKAQTLIEVNLKLQTASEKNMEQAREFVKTGEKPKLEFLKAQASYLSNHFNYLKAKQALATAMTHLNGAMGILNPPSYRIKQDFTIPPFNFDLLTAKAVAFKTKPQLVLAKAKIVEAQARVNQFRATRWPVLAANGSYGWVDQTFPPGLQTWTLGMSLQWSLFDGNKLTHEINESVALQKRSEEEEKTVRLQVEEELEQSYRAYQSAQEQLTVAKEEAAQAEEANRLAEARYKVGLAPFLEVADSQAKLSVAKGHEVEALTDLRLSQSAVKRSIGIEEP